MPPSPAPLSAPRVFAVRHAPTLAAGLCVGDSEVDSAMSPAEAATQIQALVGDRPFQQIWSSSLSRCSTPARLVSEHLRIPHGVDERVREISLGQWQGKTWSDIEASDAERFHAWLQNWRDQAPPGGEGPAQLELRVRAWWNGLSPGNHLLVAHAGVVRALRVLVHAQPWPEAMAGEVPYLQGEWF